MKGFMAVENTEYLPAGWPTLPRVLLLLSGLFFFQPILAILALTIICLLLEKPSLLLLTVLASMISCYLGLLNLARTPVSDLMVYLDWVALARELDFIEFMAIHPKEPGYFLYMYLLANLPGSSDGLFIFVSTVVPYWIVLAALARFGCKLSLPSHVIVGILIFFAFFPPLFNNSAHLLRQFLAGALIAWFYIEYTSGTKRSWWILLLALTMHTTALIFLPLALVGSIRKYSPGKLLMIAVLVLLSLLLLLNFVGPYLTSMPYLGDIIKRLLAGVYFEHKQLGMAPLLLLFVVCVFSLYKLCISLRFEKIVTRKTACNLYLSTFFLCIFIGWAHLTGETMLATRFLLYVFFLVGPILLFALADVQQKKIFTSAVLVTMPIYFVYTVVNGVWTYGGYGIWTSFATLLYDFSS
jgi:hypothetical protein